MQTTSTLLMIRPKAFGYNAETAVNNAFQQACTDEDTHTKAQKEFDDFVALLQSHQIQVTVIDDTAEPYTPDSIFPNNWASYHSNGTVVLYPMFAANRRKERDKQVVEKIGAQFSIHSIIDLTAYENTEAYLEGTGSMVLDREHTIAYACLSPRTHANVLHDFCEQTGYTPVSFTATDTQGQQIYHTNVMMCVADTYAILCAESITDAEEKEKVEQQLKNTGKTIIAITREQMNQFAGNMLQVHNTAGKKFLVMSSQAYHSLTQEQIGALQSFNPILHAPLYTIEKNGGGSARCMMAEIFLLSK